MASSRRASIAVGRLVLVGGWLAVGAVIAQVNAVTFKNFHRYPTSGLWTQELSGTHNGVSTGPPIRSTSCAGVATPENVEMLQKLGSANAANCKTIVITDTERLAEYEQICDAGGAQHVIHHTMKAVDHKTLTVDTRDDISGSIQITAHSNVSYGGPCTAPAAPKPSAAECAELASAMQGPQASDALCAEMPPASQAQCLSRVDSARKMTEAAQAQCR